MTRLRYLGAESLFVPLAVQDVATSVRAAWRQVRPYRLADRGEHDEHVFWDHGVAEDDLPCWMQVASICCSAIVLHFFFFVCVLLCAVHEFDDHRHWVGCVQFVCENCVGGCCDCMSSLTVIAGKYDGGGVFVSCQDARWLGGEVIAVAHEGCRRCVVSDRAALLGLRGLTNKKKILSDGDGLCWMIRAELVALCG